MHYIKVQLDNMQLVQYPIALVLTEWSNTGTRAFLKLRKINYRIRVGLRE